MEISSGVICSLFEKLTTFLRVYNDVRNTQRRLFLSMLIDHCLAGIGNEFLFAREEDTRLHTFNGNIAIICLIITANVSPKARNIVLPSIVVSESRTSSFLVD